MAYKNFIKIGNVRVDTNAIVAYDPLWTEGRITSLALRLDGCNETVRAAVTDDEARDFLITLDNLKIR